MEGLINTVNTLKGEVTDIRKKRKAIRFKENANKLSFKERNNTFIQTINEPEPDLKGENSTKKLVDNNKDDNVNINTNKYNDNSEEAEIKSKINNITETLVKFQNLHSNMDTIEKDDRDKKNSLRYEKEDKETFDEEYNRKV